MHAVSRKDRQQQQQQPQPFAVPRMDFQNPTTTSVHEQQAGYPNTDRGGGRDNKLALLDFSGVPHKQPPQALSARPVASADAEGAHPRREIHQHQTPVGKKRAQQKRSTGSEQNSHSNNSFATGSPLTGTGSRRSGEGAGRSKTDKKRRNQQQQLAVVDASPTAAAATTNAAGTPYSTLVFQHSPKEQQEQANLTGRVPKRTPRDQQDNRSGGGVPQLPSLQPRPPAGITSAVTAYAPKQNHQNIIVAHTAYNNNSSNVANNNSSRALALAPQQQQQQQQGTSSSYRRRLKGFQLLNAEEEEEAQRQKAASSGAKGGKNKNKQQGEQPSASSAATATTQGPAYHSLEGARIRRQIYILCQKLFQNSDTSMEVVVSEEGKTVWRSTNVEADIPTVDVDVVDEDVEEVRRRSKNAFAKTVEAFKQRIADKDREMEQLRADTASKEQGGLRFISLQADLETARNTNRQQQAKIKSLVKLLDRAGSTIKKHEDQQHRSEMEGENSPGSRRGSQFPGGAGGGKDPMDWISMQNLLKDLIIDDREDHQILRDVIAQVESLQNKIEDLESSNEMFAEKYGEKEAFCELLRRERDKLNVDHRAGKQELQDKKALCETLSAENASLQHELAELRRRQNDEQTKFLKKIQELEASIKTAVESKSHFIGHGKSRQIPLFLRYDGKIKNLDLSKEDVENVINSVWATRDADKTVNQNIKKIALGQMTTTTVTARALQRTLEKNTLPSHTIFLPSPELLTKYCSGPAPTALQDDGTGAGAAAPAVTGVLSLLPEVNLVDYNNTQHLRFIKEFSKRGFREHFTRFLFEHFATGKAASVADPVGALARAGAVLPQGIAEVSYSLVEGCEKYKFDADIELFRRIAKDEISELAFYDQMAMLFKLKLAFWLKAKENELSAMAAAAAAASSPSTKEGDENGIHSSPSLATLDLETSISSTVGTVNFAELVLSVEDIVDVSSVFFRAKSAENFAVLRKALTTDANVMIAAGHVATASSASASASAAGTQGHAAEDNDAPAPSSPSTSAPKLKLSKLFQSNEHGNQMAFVEAVRDQQVEEACIYSAEVSAAVSLAAALENPTATSGNESTDNEQQAAATTYPSVMATLGAVRTKIAEVDPQKPPADVDSYLKEVLLLAAADGGAGGALEGYTAAQLKNTDVAAIPLSTLVNTELLSAKCKGVFVKRFSLRHYGGGAAVGSSVPTSAAPSSVAGGLSHPTTPYNAPV